MANAGPDLMVGCAGPTTPNVFLNGTASSDPDGDPLTYEWSEGGTILAITATANLTLKAGVHNILLTVTDSWSHSTTDTVTVTVQTVCDGATVTVNENVTIDFNFSPPVCSDGDTPDLCDFFTYEQPSGVPADQWKAIFDLGGKALLLNANKSIKTIHVPATGSVRKSPGIEIRTTCTVTEETGAKIKVESVNDLAGDLLIQADGGVTINGTVANEVEFPQGRSGKVTIASCCGDITIGPQALVQTWNGDLGGRDINLLACCGGDVAVNGAVTAVHSKGAPPTINVASFFGKVTINGTNDFGEKNIGGTVFRRASGLFVMTSGEPGAGNINIQAKKDVDLVGHRILDWHRPQTTAVHVRPYSASSQGGDGEIHVVSLEGKINTWDHAVTIGTQFNGLNSMTLEAKGDVSTNVTTSIDDGASTNTKIVLYAVGGSPGQGGGILLRSFAGNVAVGANTKVHAGHEGSSGTDGTVQLTACDGVSVGSGSTVIPDDLNPGDDSGVCTPPSPTPNFVDCLSSFGGNCQAGNIPNQAPVANAGPDLTITLPSAATLSGTATDDGRPTGSSLAVQWTKQSGPGAVSFTLPNQAATQATFSAAGTYVLRLTADDSLLTGDDDVTVVVNPGNLAPTVNAGPDQSITLPSNQVPLQGSASDDNLPNGTLTFNWTMVGGSGQVTFSAPDQLTTLATFPAFGTYTLSLTASDSQLEASDEVIVTVVSQAPVVDAGPDQRIALPVNTVPLQGSVTGEDPTTILWSKVGGPGPVVFNPPDQPITDATFTDVGIYQLRLLAANAQQVSAFDDVTVYFSGLNQPPVANAGPEKTVVLPATSTTLQGTAGDDQFPLWAAPTPTVEWKEILAPGPVTYSPDHFSVQPDVTLTTPGVYLFELRATDTEFYSTSYVRVTFGDLNQPPVVDAGPNRVIVFPQTASLQGNVADDGKPAPFTTLWSQVSGPGTASFSDATVLNPTVTFIARGVYVLRLTATDSQLETSRDVTIFAGHVQCTRSNKGTDFWLMFPANSQTTQQVEAQLLISSDTATSGTVTAPGLGFSDSFTVQPGQVIQIPLTLATETDLNDQKENKGIHIQAQAPVAVYGMNYFPQATDAFTALPTVALGTEYFTLSYRNTTVSNGQPVGTQFGIVATQNNTTVNIVPSTTTLTGIATRTAGVPYPITLNQGETYLLRNTTYDEANTYDLSGSHILSDKPVAVFASHRCTVIPNRIKACNYLIEQVPPVDTWGTHFLSLPFVTQSSGDTFRILASADNTSVSINGSEVAVLHRGQYHEQILLEPAEIIASQPVLVAQYSNSSEFSGSENVDPFMVYVQPFDQFGGAYTVSTPSTGFPENYVNVVAPTESAQAGGVLLDGVPVPDTLFQPIGASGFSGAQISAPVGTHTLSSPMPFGITSYGGASFDGYGYIGGVCLATDLPSGQINLSADATTHLLATEATLTATVTDAFGSPSGGVGVAFKVVGVHSLTQLVTTGSDGVAEFRYTGSQIGSDLVTAGVDQTSSNLTLSWIVNGPNQAPVVNVGADLAVELPANVLTLNGIVLDDGQPIGAQLTFLWTQVQGPPVTFADPAKRDTQAFFTDPGNYVLRLTADDTQLSASNDLTVTVYPPNQAPAVSAGPDQSIQLPTDTVTLTGSAPDDGLPLGSTVSVTWVQVSGPTANPATPDQLSTSITFPGAGTYIYELRASDSQLTSTATVQVIVHPADAANQPPAVSVTPIAPIRLPSNTVNLQATATDDGIPATLNVSWAQISGPSGVTFGNSAQAATTATFPAAGTYALRLSADDSQFISSATITVIVLPANGAPAVNAGLDQVLYQANAQVLLNGSASDDGLPASPLTVQWSQFSGPAGVVFSSPSQPVTFATLPDVGTYVLKLEATDTDLSSSDLVTVTVHPANQPPTVNAGNSQVVPFIVEFPINQPPIKKYESASLDGMIGHDGLLAGVPLAKQWSQMGGPGLVTFDNPQAEDTMAHFSAPGDYVLRLSANDGQYTSYSVVQISAQVPVLDAGPDQTITLGQTVNLNGAVTVGGQPAPLIPAYWSVAQQAGSVSFTDPLVPVTQATFTAAGIYVLRLHSGSSQFGPLVGGPEDIVTIAVLPVGAPPGPTVSITSPAPPVPPAPPQDPEITEPTAVVGLVSDGNWTLEYSLQDEQTPQPFVTLATGAGPVNNAQLGTALFDPTLLRNGSYTLRLRAEDAFGRTASASVNVDVTRAMKVGVFTISFNDLTVPLAGLPIQVVRTYDTRDKDLEGDFGHGWTLSTSNIRLQKKGNLALNWFQDVTISGFSTTYSITSTSTKTITITFPDGKVYRFRAEVIPASQSFAPITTPTLIFAQIPGATGTAGATLVPLDGGAALWGASIPGPGSLLGYDGNPYNPTRFRLTTTEGFEYVLNQQTGLEGLTDPNGNTLTFTTNGISHSSGRSLTWTRDGQGRITRITDPDGKFLSYAYGADGDLLQVTDRVDDVTTFTYQPLLVGTNHRLMRIFDPERSVTVVDNTYDSAGRLTDTKDGAGKNIHYQHDIPNRRETITDRLTPANSTVYLYDDHGNVTQITDAEGGITLSTYDADDNLISEVNPVNYALVGRPATVYTYDPRGNRLTETDPLGHPTTFTYSTRNQVEKVTVQVDAQTSRTTTNAYDTRGNLTSTTDNAGKMTAFEYDSRGLLTKTTADPGGINAVTEFTYDSFGNLLTEKDALNTTTSYTYDSRGNRLTQSVTRTTPSGPQTLTTQFTYDAQSRLTKTTHPDGTFTEITYNNIGQQASTKDELGRVTSFAYDNLGRLTRTTYPDLIFEQSNYDAEGRRTNSTDRGGHLSQYFYDKLGRLIKTTFPDNSFTETVYDANGQVTKTRAQRFSTDPIHETQFDYDDAGRRTTVTDALGKVTFFDYYDDGQQKSILDARNNLTEFFYDADGRLIETRLPAVSGQQHSELTNYDALGRVKTRTDAAGVITQFDYDALGRLTTVTNAVGQPEQTVTRYEYDELGSRTKQIDAMQPPRETRYEYDQRGRRTKRALPLTQPGQEEIYTYDEVGNLKTRKGFNGRTTTYTYDNLNRLTTKTPDAFFAGAVPVEFTYTATGKRNTMKDASGITDLARTTSYTYHPQSDRLTQKFNTALGGLSYNYDAAGNLTSIGTFGAAGSLTMSYTYDALNRLATVANADTGSTSYTYDDVGNLLSVTQPNGVVHSYTYDARNRLTTLAVNGPGATPPALASYAYTLAPTGHRLSVAELSGRSVAYTYDNLYRLTSETIAGDTSAPTPQNGLITYNYDAVGNRAQLASTVPAIPAGLWNYDANDRFTAGDTYDANGNTVSSGGIAATYDFENHLVSKGGVTLVYDGDGHRVKKTVAGVTTTYVVDELNPTGFAQVLVETISGQFFHNQFVYGLDLISQRRQLTVSTFENRFYAYDGHGSVRQLTDSTGAVTDTYAYDAFGNLLAQTFTGPAPTPNHYLYAGEQFDPDLNLYYNRARYLDVRVSRFWTMDSFEGQSLDPSSLHKYVYAGNAPTMYSDPSGLFTQAFGYAVEREIQPQYVATHPGDIVLFGKWGRVGLNIRLRPDILNFTARTWLEIKPLSISGVARALIAWSIYSANFDPVQIHPDSVWIPPAQPISVGRVPILVFNVQGILFYTDAFDNIEDVLALKAVKTLPQAVRLLSRLGGAIAEPGRIRGLVQLVARATQAVFAQIRGLVNITALSSKF